MNELDKLSSIDFSTQWLSLDKNDKLIVIPKDNMIARFVKSIWSYGAPTIYEHISAERVAKVLHDHCINANTISDKKAYYSILERLNRKIVANKPVIRTLTNTSQYHIISITQQNGNNQIKTPEERVVKKLNAIDSILLLDLNGKERSYLDLCLKKSQLIDQALKILKCRDKIISRLAGVNSDTHFCKKNSFKDVGYSVNYIDSQVFVSIPNSLFIRGGEKTLHLSVEINSGKIVARSKKRMGTDKQYDQFIKNRFNDSPYLMKYYGTLEYKKFSNETVCCSIMKLYKLGDSILFLLDNQLSYKELIKCLLSGALAFQTLHQNKITFNDVKLENFLRGKNMNLVLTDFSFIQDWQKDPGPRICERKGTVSTIAPERLFDNHKFTFETHAAGDIFSFGVVCWCLTNHRQFAPWFFSPEDRDFFLVLSNFNQDMIDKCLPKPKNKLDELICEMLRYDSSKRPTIDEVVNRLRSLSERND